MLSFSVLAVLYLFLIIVYYGIIAFRGKKVPPGTRQLPGPRGLPFIGRVHDVPSVATWLKFYDWSKVYGPIYQMEIFGSVHVWISSEEMAHDLLSKRSAIYSDRPVIPNLPDNRTSGNYLALLGRTETWKRQRKVCHQVMARSSSESLYNYPAIESKRLLYHMSRTPSDYIGHIEQYTSRTISRLSWGSPHFADELRVGTFGLLQTISPSGAVPNIVSPLSYLPAWLSPWKQVENARHLRERKFFEHCINSVKSAVAKGTAMDSYMKVFLETKDNHGMPEEEGQYLIGMMAIAGALTAGSPLQSYILAMCCYPEWQAKLREEMRACIGDRAPEWQDREQLPLLRAVVKEVVRWRPPVPTGIPHRLEKDDVYNGYHIPAGATIHALEWAMTRDPLTYPSPEEFNPARYLDPSFPTFRAPLTVYPNLKSHTQFGFGRRTCTGIEIVEQELFLVMGGLAWAFDFSKKKKKKQQQQKKGDDGMKREEEEEEELDTMNYTSLLIAKPEKFEFCCSLVDGRTRRELEWAWRAVNGGGVGDRVEGEEEGGRLGEEDGDEVLYLGTPTGSEKYGWGESEGDSEGEGEREDEGTLVEKEVLGRDGEEKQVERAGGWK
ncbi:uncharacterized protein L3040_002526 [Drepanopeziza brunnea f. sp. 'multigermtubi']|uniref:uncharacterized protein n=1 Tax=Drepanopeziza brunnea f. sp. 'multigermtubi' TaxID=698441 RepID=UPI0023998E2F|nr:hypothetical protein L3040_002526 [Drepanopeziza brunnea f. sp. 'multigermtubi']